MNATSFQRTIGTFQLLLCCLGATSVFSADSPNLEQRVQSLEKQNQALQEQLRQQHDIIEQLTRRLDAESGSSGAKKAESDSDKAPARAMGLSLGNVRLGGEAGLAFFHTSSTGQYAKSEFGVDDAKLFVEAPLWNRAYFFGGLDLLIRERQTGDDATHLGELYVDFESISLLWGEEDQLSLRAGRLNIPFGEEYLVRNVVDNPLVTHSLSDIWGIDEGVEFYGKYARLDYVLAVQNGGRPSFHDYDGDKAVTARVGFRAAPWLRLSASGMRTGHLDVGGDRLSEVWFGNGFFRALGSAATTTKFEANLVEGDAQFSWKGGRFKTAVGYAEVEDNDTTRDNRRHVLYYYLEPTQDITSKLYAAARFSQIIADNGLPIAGLGPPGPYFFGPLQTEDIWRASIGVGYRWSANLSLKVEYSREQRELRNAGSESDDFLGTEIGLKF